MNLIRSIINFFGFNDAIVDGIGERGMRDSSIIRYNEVHDMYDKIIKDLGDMSAYVSKGYIYDKIKERTGLREKILGLYKKERIINLSFLFLTVSTLTWIRYIHACSIANTITSA